MSDVEAGDARRRPAIMWTAVVVLLAAHCVLANAAAWNKCGMFDEASHLGGGYSFARTGDYRMLPLAIAQQRWMTLPLLLTRPWAPSTDQPLWFSGDNWGYGRQLLFELNNDPMQILRWTRWMTSLLSVALGLLVFLWSRALFGTAGGFVSLLLYAFNPTVLAHAAAATTDMSAALAFTAAALSLWCILERVTPLRLSLSSLVWGLALAAKFSTVLLLPIAGLIVVVRCLSGKPLPVRMFAGERLVASRSAQVLYYLLITLVHMFGAWLVIWALFGFQFEMFREFPHDPKRSYLGTFDELAAGSRGFEPILRFAHKHRLLPEGYLYCFAETVRTTGGRVCFLDGWFGIYGFTSFFPLAFLYKTPPAFFFLLLVAVAAHLALRLRQMRNERRTPRSLLWEGFYATAPLWCILAIYGSTSIFGRINLGIRHILPLFAPMFILCGVAGLWFSQLAEPQALARSGVDKFRRVLKSMQAAVITAASLYILDTVSAYPNYLAYFNLPSGGIEGGHRRLVDSSLDWGQELPALRQWLDAEGLLTGAGRPRIYLSYFGTTPPSSVDFRPALLPCYFDRETLDPNVAAPFEPRLSEGVYCISATMLQSLYTSPFSGPWQERYDRKYFELLRDIVEFAKASHDSRQIAALISKQGKAWWTERHVEFERARLARLCAFLRTREPVHIVNGAILVYKLTAADLEQALSLKIPTRPDAANYDRPIPY